MVDQIQFEDFQNWLADYKSEIAQIVRYLKRGDLIPFLGAGMSFDSGMPLWGRFLIDQAKKFNCLEDVRSYLNQDKYEHAASQLQNKIGLNGLNGLVQNAFGAPPDEVQLNGSVMLIPELFPSGKVVTTNFDRVLEASYHRRDLSYQSIDGLDFTRLHRVHNSPNTGDVTIFKIHGDAGGNRRVLTLDEYDEAYGPSTLSLGFDRDAEYPRSLIHLFEAQQPFLFLGCSLASDRTMVVLEWCSNQPGANFSHFALVANDPNDEDQQANLIRKGIIPLVYPEHQHEYIRLFLQFLIDERKLSPSIDGRGGTNFTLVGK